MCIRDRLPPARIIVVLGNLEEPKLFIVVRTDPLGGIDGAFFKRRIEVATGNLLGHSAKCGKDVAAEAGDPHFQALEVFEALDFLAEPAAHLDTGIAASEGKDVVVAVELSLIHISSCSARLIPCRRTSTSASTSSRASCRHADSRSSTSSGRSSSCCRWLLQLSLIHI